MEQVDVAIVGYGPVGAVLANLLGRDGWRVAVFEREPSVYHLPRAAHFDHEIMRVFQSVGLAEAILPATCWIRGMHFVNAHHEFLFGFEQPDGLTASGWNNDYMFYQPQLELELRRGVDRYDNVSVFLEHEVNEIRAHDREEEGSADGGGDVVVEARDLRTGADVSIQASYVVGCDGARSVTRKLCGIELEDLTFNEPWLVTDVILKQPVDLPDLSYQYCDPARPTTYVPMPEPRRRWEFMLLPGETADEMEQPDKVLELLAPWLTPEQCEVERARVYTFHALVAKRWRAGRVLIAGDAAHQTPPFLGQGMCAGIRDVVNLEWKLDLVLRGVADDRLLDTYEPERAPHVRAYIETAVTVGAMICTLDPDVAASRDRHFLSQADRAPRRNDETMIPPLGPGLLYGPYGETQGTPQAPAGRLFPQPWVIAHPAAEAGEAAVRLDDLIGPQFALVATNSALLTDVTARAAEVAAKLGVALVALDDPTAGEVGASVAGHGFDAAVSVVTPLDPLLERWFATADADVALVRPDRYVYGVESGPEGAARLLESLGAALGFV